MTNCEACGSENSGPGRHCRNCGAPAVTSVEDLADTREFEHNERVRVAQPGSGPIYATPSNTFPLAPGSVALFDTGSLLRKFNRMIRGKIGWVVIFLLLSLLVPTGILTARDFVRARRARRYELAREAESLRQQRKVRQAESNHKSSVEAIQNALGFKPAAVSAAEYPAVKGVFVSSLTSDFGPAGVAKVQAGDIVTDFDGQPVEDAIGLKQSVERSATGAEVPIKLFRDGATIGSTIRIADRAAPFQPRATLASKAFWGSETFPDAAVLKARESGDWRSIDLSTTALPISPVFSSGT